MWQWVVFPAFLRRGGREADGAVGKGAEPPYGFPRSAPYSVRCAEICKEAAHLYQPPRLRRSNDFDGSGTPP